MEVSNLKGNGGETSFADNIYSSHLKIINGVAFTRREIDIISCLLNGRTTKKVASILRIAPKTAENHIRNIMLKLSCRSQEGIIDFVEKSGKFTYIKKYYTHLLLHTAFISEIEKMAAEKIADSVDCFFIYFKEKVISGHLEEHLKLIGISSTSEIWDKEISNHHIHSAQFHPLHQRHFICILPSTFIEKLKTGDKKAFLELQEFIQRFKNIPFFHLIAFNKPSAQHSSNEFPIEFKEYINHITFYLEEYYSLFFQILKKILPTHDIDKYFEYFNQYKASVLDSKNEPSESFSSESFSQERKEQLPQGLTDFQNQWLTFPKIMFGSLVLFLIIPILAFFVFRQGISDEFVRQDPQTREHTYHHLTDAKELKKTKETIETIAVKSDDSNHPVSNNGSASNKLLSTTELESTFPLTWNLPRQDNLFIGREHLLEELHVRLKPKAYDQMSQEEKVSSTETNALAISACAGLGGIGKTQLALQYAHHTNHPYTIKVWFDAENIRELQSEYQMFAKKMGYTTNNDWISRNKEIEAVVQYVKKWFEKNPGWLIVYDNATNFETIKDFLPETGGDILITSRCQEWPHIVEILSIDVMAPEEAHSLVENLIGRDDPSIDVLTKTLEYLPLSLAQASAYIRNYNKTIEQYLSLYRQSEYTLLKDNTMPLGVNHAPVAVTWDVSLRAIEAEEHKRGIPSLSRILITICSYLSTNNISRDFLLAWTKKNYPDLVEPELALDQSLGQLKRHSLINLDSKYVSIHRMVQTILRHQHEKPSQQTLSEFYSALSQKWYEGLFEVMHQEFSRETQVLEDEARVRSLFPHVQKLVENYEILWPNKGSKFLGTIYNDMGLFFYRLLQDLKDAQFYFEKALAISEQHYGKNHVMVANILNNSAQVSRELGDEKKARTDLEKALSISEKQLGENHVEVGNILNNLGNVYREFGTFEFVNKSKICIERALAINLLHYGKNHLQTGNTLQNLGNTYRELGDANQAKILLENALTIRELNYGKRHSETARTLNRLGDVYQELGNLKHAKDLIQQALSINEEHYGKDHIYNTRSINRLGDIYRELGELQQAKALLERALAIREQFYGKDHTWLVWSLDRLGEVYKDMGEFKKARQMLERALALNEHHYGKNHVWIGKTLTLLGEVLIDMGEMTEAKLTLERALEIYEQFYGTHHIEVARTLAALGTTFEKMNDPKKAKSLFEQALVMNESHYGKHHFKILKDLSKLAGIHRSLGESNLLKERLARIESIKNKSPISNDSK